MACFIVPGTEAVVSAVAEKIVKEKEMEVKEGSFDGETVEEFTAVPFSKKLGWLTKLLAGGSALLAFEHVWHGEVSPFFPFLTAAANPVDAAEMLSEMSTTGVTMAVLVTTVWLGMLAVSNMMEKDVVNKAKKLEK